MEAHPDITTMCRLMKVTGNKRWKRKRASWARRMSRVAGDGQPLVGTLRVQFQAKTGLSYIKGNPQVKKYRKKWPYSTDLPSCTTHPANDGSRTCRFSRTLFPVYGAMLEHLGRDCSLLRNQRSRVASVRADDCRPVATSVGEVDIEGSTHPWMDHRMSRLNTDDSLFCRQEDGPKC